MKVSSILTRWDLISVAVASLLVPATLAGPNRGPDSRNFPNLNLPGHAYGQEAIQQLGVSLPGVAHAYGFDPFALRVRLSSDSTLAIDHNGRLHYTEPAANAAGTMTGAVSRQMLAPLADTFKLHSRPAAKRIIYLDFDGHVLSNTGWNVAYNSGHDIVAPAWSLDADPAFNDQERTIIQNIWQRVAEDYSAFDVDVTTELISEDQINRFDLGDEYYGIRALISPISSYFGYYGGISYVGSFDTIGGVYKPCLIFPENLGPNGESFIAEAISHEVGHSFGLSHDGTTTGCGATGTDPCGYYSGQGNWAPIMGVGYYVSIVQWSKGEYANANNLEDDLATIASYVGFRPDDHGGSADSATQLPAGSQLSVSGVITSSSDVDVFKFGTGSSGPAGTGNVSLQISPDSLSGNLDILAELRDSAGNLIAVSNPLGVLSASFNLTLPAGTYLVHVRGTGEGDAATTGYSSYSSIGQYTLTGTVVDPSPQPPVAVATAAPLVAAVGQSVSFDGSGSYDPDGGVLLSYVWSFSDGASGTGVTVGKVFTSPGAYSATLAVTDNESATTFTTVSIRVNDPPVAGITVTPGTSGKAPFAVSFSGVPSMDSDGSITKYAWSFGDGTTATGLNVSKTYNTVGTYNAKLTVTDNNGAVGSKTVAITVTSDPGFVLHVQSIAMAVQGVGPGKTVSSTILVFNSNGQPVSGITVNGKWSGVVGGPDSAVTGSTGQVTVVSPKVKSSGTATFTVTGLNRNGYSYNSSLNVVSSGSIVVP